MSTELVARIPRARRIRPPKLPRWMWTVGLVTLVTLGCVLFDAGLMIREPSANHGFSLVGACALFGAWYHHLKACLRAWKKHEDSTAMPREPMADRTSVVLWITSIAVLFSGLFV